MPAPIKHRIEPGQRFGRLEVIAEAAFESGKKRRAECRCDCGAVKVIVFKDLVRGFVQSCGCLRDEGRKPVHGHSPDVRSTGTYNSWAGMVQRCTNDKHPKFPDYGGRGITVCPEWATFAGFLADMGERPAGRYSIGRVNNDLGYHKDNCRWETDAQQASNRRPRRTGHTRRRAA